MTNPRRYLMKLTEIYQKHKKKMFKSPELLEVSDNIDLFKTMNTLPAKDSMYMNIVGSSKNFEVSVDQKYRYVLDKFKNEIKFIDPVTHDQIISKVFESFINHAFVKAKQGELDFVKRDILTSIDRVEGEKYALKMKSSGKGYINRNLFTGKHFNIDENEINVVNVLKIEINRSYIALSYHMKGDNVIFFTQKEESTGYTKEHERHEFNKNDPEFLNIIYNYFGKLIFDTFWKKELRRFYHNSEYDYEIFELNHLTLLEAYKF